MIDIYDVHSNISILRVHLALKAYQELLHTLDMMDRSKNTQLIESSKVIKSKLSVVQSVNAIVISALTMSTGHPAKYK